jgi:hypothetical protein
MSVGSVVWIALCLAAVGAAANTTAKAPPPRAPDSSVLVAREYSVAIQRTAHEIVHGLVTVTFLLAGACVLRAFFGGPASSPTTDARTRAREHV